jgi:hypothetical protein
MKHLFVPYHIDLLAKDKGFDEFCFAYYRSDALRADGKVYEYIGPNEYMEITEEKDVSLMITVFAPLYQQLVDWFREKHNLHISVRPAYALDTSTRWIGTVTHIKWKKLDRFKVLWSKGADFKSPTEAFDKAFEKAFKLI